MQIPYLIKQQKGKWFLISIEVPWRAGERSQLFLLAQWAPGPLLAVSRTITAEPQKINWWLLSWDIAPGSSWWSLMHWHAWTILLNQSQLPQSGQAHRIKQTLFPFRITRLNPGPQNHLACAVSQGTPKSCLKVCETVLAKNTPETALTALQSWAPLPGNLWCSSAQTYRNSPSARQLQ